MSNKNWKWVYTFVMLFATIGWGVFTVMIVRDAALKIENQTITQIDLISAAGASGLMGALIGWNSLIIQHWFRKKIEEPINE